MRSTWIGVLLVVLLLVGWGWYQYRRPLEPPAAYSGANPHNLSQRTRPKGPLPIDPQYVANASVMFDSVPLSSEEERNLQRGHVARVTGKLTLADLPQNRDVFGIGIAFASEDNSPTGWCLEYNQQLDHKRTHDQVQFSGDVTIPESPGTYAVILVFYHFHIDDAVIPPHFVGTYPVRIDAKSGSPTPP